MNKVEEKAINIHGKDRFEKRENLAHWLDSFLKNDSDCEGYTIKRINLPNNEFMQMIFFRVYSRSYAWIDYLRNNLLDSSRLEYIDADLNAHIIFEDDFGVESAFDNFMDLAAIYGIVDVL